MTVYHAFVQISEHNTENHLAVQQECFEWPIFGQESFVGGDPFPRLQPSNVQYKKEPCT
jgi:hypothetical protein